MKINLLLICAVAALMINGCKKDTPSPTPTPAATAPVANFTYTGAGTFAPASVSFASTSTNATSYSWDFGDNGTSTDANPSHLFTSGGTYTVRLTVTGTGGSNSVSKTINILNTPTSVKVTFIKLREYPEYNSGSFWDAINPNPDLQVDINNGSTILYSTGTIWEASYSVRPYSWSVSPAYQLPSINAAYTVWLYNDDTDTGGGYQIMSFAVFNPSNYGYVNSIDFDYNGTAFTVGLQWQ